MNAPDFNISKRFPENGSSSARRSVGRSRSLPSGRAAIGALLVVLSGLGLTAAARRASAEPTTKFAVATRDIPAGTQLQAGDIQFLTMELATDVAKRSFTAGTSLVGAVAVNPLSSGELIQYSAVQAGGPSLRSMSFPIEAARAVNGELDPGDRVDIVATTNETDKRTETVLRNLEVISVSGASLDPGSNSELVITVSIEDPQHQTVLAQAVNTGDLFVVRANDGRTEPQAQAKP